MPKRGDIVNSNLLHDTDEDLVIVMMVVMLMMTMTMTMTIMMTMTMMMMMMAEAKLGWKCNSVKKKKRSGCGNLMVTVQS